MVTCKCGKTIEKVPNWLEAVTVEFVCTNCPNKTVKNITETSFPTLESQAKEQALKYDPEGIGLGDDEDEDED